MLICWIPSAYALASKVLLRLVTFCFGKETRRTIGDMVVRSGKRWWKMMLDIGNWYYFELTLIGDAALMESMRVKRYLGRHIGP